MCAVKWGYTVVTKMQTIERKGRAYAPVRQDIQLNNVKHKLDMKADLQQFV